MCATVAGENQGAMKARCSRDAVAILTRSVALFHLGLEFFGWEGVVGCLWPLSDVSRPTGGPREFGVVVSRCLVSQLEDSVYGPNRLPNFVDLPGVLAVDDLKGGDHVANLLNSIVQFLLLRLENVDQVLDLVKAALALGAVVRVRQELLCFILGHQTEP